MTDFRYAIFDMDGTLLDSISYWDRLALDYLEERGVIGPSDLNERMVSMSFQEAAVFLKEEFHLSEDVGTIYEELNGRIMKRYAEDIPLKDGVSEWIRYLKEQGVSMCVATASSAELGKSALIHHGILEYFDFLVDCGMVGVGKTSPDVYLLAADRFGCRPSECMVAEDASFALETAKKAGFYTIGVWEPTEEDPERVRAYSDCYIRNFKELLL